MEHLGRDAARRAVTVGVVVGLIGAAILGLIVYAVSDVRGGALYACFAGAALAFGMIGALWGAFSRLGRGEDWREAVTADQRPSRVVHEESRPSAGTEDEVEHLEARGATEVHVVDEDPARRPENQVDRP